MENIEESLEDYRESKYATKNPTLEQWTKF